jgi:hypothetical protein
MLEDILQALHPETYLCITDITNQNISREHLPGKRNIDLHNRPSILSSIKCSFCRSVNYFVHLIIKKKENKKRRRSHICIRHTFFIV